MIDFQSLLAGMRILHTVTYVKPLYTVRVYTTYDFNPGPKVT